jgi:hypothetical protein
MEEILDEKESAFLKELERLENKWVAIIESNGARRVVGSGNDAVEAMGEAESKGFGDAFLLKVQPFDRGYIPANR